jgi:hypothetical protein
MANAAMTEIEEYQYDTDGDLVKWLRKNVDVVNFQEVAERLSARLGKE